MLARLRRWLSAPGGRTLARRQAAALERLERRIEGVAARLEQVAERIEAVRMAQSATLDDSTALTLCASGHMILVDTRCRDIAPHLMMSGVWEPEYLAAFRRLIRPGDTVFDIGANHGVYTLAAAAAVGPAGRVHAFEPNPRYARLVEQSVRLNGFASVVRVHRVAVSDRAGEARLRFGFAHAGGARLAPDDAEEPAPQGAPRAATVRKVALDAMFRRPETVPHAVKLDIEGHEGFALLGMRGLLERSPGVRLMLEFAPRLMRDAGMGAEATIALLEGLGFRFWTVGADSRLVPTEASQLRAMEGGLMNIVAARQAPEA
ncbi:hypothetical protein GCM10010964_38930 [Caldovatus sediminis]|uniref:Methyltransferase FkbM domain-containing protein n=1 Tax=Caldovatus sediminis TaxID=2041189 RepID=A0A8J3EDU5_9PROT|nr:FkbM family methyltransferase [Caldovatus sediminis]GGG47754.1 hypothetical protein GCM10010964_38930 [Caldovatus sediminis]